MDHRLDLPLPQLADQFLLRPDVTFLNHGSFGACPRPVFERYQAWQRELEAQPVDFLVRRLPGLLTEARTALASTVGAAPEDLVFVANATFGVNIVARSLDLQPGDEVLTTNHEYGAAERAWRFNCRQRGARLVHQPLPLPVQEPEELVEALWQGVTPRTRVIFLSHITSPTALILPVQAICQRAREAGILTLVDGAHAPGQVALDLEALGPDFYTGNCHKWLCSPKGAAFLYARPEHQALLDPLVVSWGWESPQPGPSPFLDYFEWIGTVDPAPLLSVPEAIRFLEEWQWPAVREACHRLGGATRARIQELTGLAPLCPESSDWWVQMFAAPLPVPLGSAPALRERLWEEFRIEVPVLEWEGRTLIRVSVQAYNSPAQMDRLLEALAVCLAELP